MSGKLKEVRERITSVNSTKQITNAMKMVSAAKLKKAQDAITDMRPYANKLADMLSNILSNLEGDAASAFGLERPIVNAAIVVTTSNRGLCGAFNTNVIKSATATVKELYSDVYEAGNLTFYYIGKKGNDVLKKTFPNATHVMDYADVINNTAFDNVSPLSQLMMDRFIDGTYDSVHVCYGSFRNAAIQNPISIQFLPVEKIEAEGGETNAQYNADYLFEPSKEILLEKLIPSILQTSFHKYVLDTSASEHGARMTAMDKATENATELIKELKITYNKARQEAITKEILEIVGGAAALEG